MPRCTETTRNISKQELYMHTLGVVMRYYEYGGYGREATKAIKALSKKFPSLSKRKCGNAFVRTLRLYEDAIVFVEKYQRYYLEKYRRQVKEKGHSHQEIVFIKAHPAIPKSVIMATIHWIFDWRHLR